MENISSASKESPPRHLRSVEPPFDAAGYKNQLLSLHKVALFEEMMRYHEERETIKTPSYYFLQKGTTLFAVIEFVADSADLRSLASSYRRQLEYQMTLS